MARQDELRQLLRPYGVDPSEPSTPLWPLEGDAPVEALRTVEVSGEGHAIVFRRRGEILKAKPEYVVNTSEFNDVKARLYAMHNRRKLDTGKSDPNRPTLRRAPGSGTGPIDENDKNTKPDQDERPTLKRRDN